MRATRKELFQIGIRLLLFITIAFATRVSLRAEFSDYYVSGYVSDIQDVFLEAIPKQVRDFAADYLWVTADEYMHYGPSKRLAKEFLAGSFAANTEIMPILELAIFLEPQHMEAYEILSQNLSMYLDRYQDGIRLLQRGIFFNKTSPHLHELYASIAFIYAFPESYNLKIRNNRVAALKYLDAALKAYERNAGDQVPRNEVFYPQNYCILQARFLVEQGKPQEALAAWNRSGKSLYSSEDYLAKYLRKVERGEEVPRLPEDLDEIKALMHPPAPISQMDEAGRRPPDGSLQPPPSPGQQSQTALASAPLGGECSEPGCDHHSHGGEKNSLAGANPVRGILTRSGIVIILGFLLIAI